MTLDTTIAERARVWSTHAAFDEATRNEVQALLDQNEEQELTERFYKDLEFGTGGMRGILGAGTSRMNIYNVRKASQAYANYLKKTLPDQPLKFAIAYDSRRFSREFAEAAASVYAANGLKVYLTKELRPVPMLSFMVRHFECHGGVCVTASHNPPDYNGYKVYWGHGGQVTPPHDNNVIAEYAAIDDYSTIKTTDFKVACESGQIEMVGEEFDQLYFHQVKKLSLNDSGRDGFKIVYSPLHGAGLHPVTTCLEAFGFQNVYVPEAQREPDGTFPTVKFPNPEDPAALSMGLELAKKIDADLIMATDPDADRIGFIVKEGNDYFTPNGNQIGCLLVDYILRGQKAAGLLPENPLVVKTIVTTELQKDIAEHYGVTCDDTLTGFKWICQRIEAYEKGELQPKRQFVCGGEESYGFMAGNFIRDKDGVSACCLVAEMVAWHKSEGRTIRDALVEIFQRHGCYQEQLQTLTMPGKDGAEAIARIMQNLRTNPPKEFAGIAVKTLLDYQQNTQSSLVGGQFVPQGQLGFPKSNVLQFLLADGSKISARPSGTEPKIKFYVSVKDGSAMGQSAPDVAAIWNQTEKQARSLTDQIIGLAKKLA